MNKKTLLKFFKNPLNLIGTLIIIMLILVAVFAPYIAKFDPIEISMNDKLLPPGSRHLFGTDEMGRDIFSRIVYGARISLAVGIEVVTFAAVIGVILGGISGYFGGWIDEIIMRITDMFLSFPSFILAMAVAAALGPSLTNAVMAVSLTWWPWYTRIVRGQILALKEFEYVEAAKAIGNNDMKIIFKHILPNCISPVIVEATMDIGFAIQLTAGLSFIGLGAQPPTAEWGAMISTGRQYILSHWWYPTFPGMAILITVLGFNLIGDGLRDFLDPKTRKFTER
ncbi:nickel transporter permease [Tepidanaerobacter syntrophicus]|uniref:nickel transporter permease n=1 Tax=Tepidanaerobacter syntrophicus TaxID=224999 RepID=UPI001BD3DD68|nr:nickel transporter permease [Tepidanaerobacter syntrophicus]